MSRLEAFPQLSDTLFAATRIAGMSGVSGEEDYPRLRREGGKVLMRRVFAAFAIAVALVVGSAASAFADQPANRPPPDRGKPQPPCTLGVELGGERICIIP